MGLGTEQKQTLSLGPESLRLKLILFMWCKMQNIYLTFHTEEMIQRSHVKVGLGPECLSCNNNKHVYVTLEKPVTCRWSG